MTAQATPPRSRIRSALRTLSTIFIVSGVLLLIDAGVTLLWQEPVSALYARIQQDRLDGQLEALTAEPPTALERKALAALEDEPSQLAFRARSLNRAADDGQPIGRLAIPDIDLSVVFVQGIDTDDLRKAPGHYPSTALPGAPGTAAIAGHRTTYGAPFRNVDDLERGDEIEVTMPYGRFTYEVERTRIVDPSDTWVTRRVDHDRLVLTACHPLYSAAQRIVVFARLVDEESAGGLI